MERLHRSLPEDMWRMRGLPGVAPVVGVWLRCDAAYPGQMAEKRQLLREKGAEVCTWQTEAEPAAAELLDCVEAELPGLGYARGAQGWLCPDGVSVPDAGGALERLGHLCQADFCLLQKPDGAEEHVLTGAVLCFPASWRLTEKIGRPLAAIHGPVADYDADLARRVQRLFDGVQAGRPIWRFNRLWYADAALYQPRSEDDARPLDAEPAPFLRCERQVVLRLPQTRAVVFAIHTYVLRRADVPEAVLAG